LQAVQQMLVGGTRATYSEAVVDVFYSREQPRQPLIWQPEQHTNNWRQWSLTEECHC